MKELSRVLVGVLCFASGGCAWATASPYDHAAYRETVVAPTLEARLQAADAYLTRYPQGAYAEAVRDYMTRAEPLFYKSRQTSVEGLEAYNATLPSGPNAEQVRSRLRAIYELAGKPDSMLVAARETEDRLRRAQAGRELARQEVAFWMGLLSDPALYEDALSRGPIEFVRAFALALPAARCVLDGVTGVRTCTKDVTAEFEVASGEGRQERLLAFSVVLTQDPEGRPVRAVLEGEELFLRVEETFAKRVLLPDTVADMQAGGARALEMMDGALSGLGVGGDVCARGPGSEGLLASYSCEGLAARVGQGKAVDRVEFVPRAPLRARLE